MQRGLQFSEQARHELRGSIAESRSHLSIGTPLGKKDPRVVFGSAMPLKTVPLDEIESESI